MGKIMALDVGSKTIGVAFCEEGTRLAFPGKTIIRQEGKRRDMAALRQLVAANDVRRIVVGMPLLLDGTRGIQAEKVDAFIADLRNHVRLPIITQDEGLSTSEAAELLTAANKRPTQHKKTIDSVAAALILEWYLEKQGTRGGTGNREQGTENTGAALEADTRRASIPLSGGEGHEPRVTGHEHLATSHEPRTTSGAANG